MALPWCALLFLPPGADAGGMPIHNARSRLAGCVSAPTCNPPPTSLPVLPFFLSYPHPTSVPLILPNPGLYPSIVIHTFLPRPPSLLQELYHIHVPHYTAMFSRLLRSPRPWRFGHLYLPSGSSNLGNPEYALAPGSQVRILGAAGARLIGV